MQPSQATAPNRTHRFLQLLLVALLGGISSACIHLPSEVAAQLRQTVPPVPDHYHAAATETPAGSSQGK